MAETRIKTVFDTDTIDLWNEYPMAGQGRREDIAAEMRRRAARGNRVARAWLELDDCA